MMICIWNCLRIALSPQPASSKNTMFSSLCSLCLLYCSTVSFYFWNQIVSFGDKSVPIEQIPPNAKRRNEIKQTKLFLKAANAQRKVCCNNRPPSVRPSVRPSDEFVVVFFWPLDLREWGGGSLVFIIEGHLLSLSSLHLENGCPKTANRFRCRLGWMAPLISSFSLAIESRCE